eukprot:m.338345 g.338345  ORF g.338345 m.338345 type:complete len:342 (+) comp16084_c0_seq10:1509-2534(+)
MADTRSASEHKAPHSTESAASSPPDPHAKWRRYYEGLKLTSLPTTLEALNVAETQQPPETETSLTATATPPHPQPQPQKRQHQDDGALSAPLSKMTTPWDSGRAASQFSHFLTCNPLSPWARLKSPQTNATTTTSGATPLEDRGEQPSLLQPQVPRTALEIGCGTGGSLLWLAKHLGFEVTGIDVVERAVALCRERSHALESDGSLSPGQASFYQLDVMANAPQDILDAINAQDTRFSLLLDCQTFHVLRQIDEKHITKVYHKCLTDDGLLLTLTGNSNEKEVGPSVLSSEQLHAAFDPLFDCLELTETRFDMTHAYATLDQPPLAWFGVWRKKSLPSPSV